MISFIPVILTFILVVFGGYIGLKRGFQKSIIRVITLLTVLILFLNLLPFFTEQLLLSFAKWTKLHTQSEQSLNFLIQKQLTPYFSSENTALLSKPIYATLLSCAIPYFIAIFYLPVHFLSWIIYLTIIVALPPSKRRQWKKSSKNGISKFSGSLISMVCALFSSMFLLFPFIINSKILQQIKQPFLEEQSNIQEVAACYMNSPIAPFYQTIGLEQFALEVNRFHATVTVDSKTYLNERELPIWLSELFTLSNIYTNLTSDKTDTIVLSNLHSAFTQFYEFPYFKDQDKLSILKDIKHLMLSFLHGTGMITEQSEMIVQFLKQMEYEDFSLLKADTEIYFEILDYFLSFDEPNVLLSDQNHAQILSKQICRLSNAPVLLPVWINYLVDKLTNSKIPKLIDGETFRAELVKLETDSTPVFQNQTLQQFKKTMQNSFTETLYEIYLEPLLNLLYQIRFPETDNFSVFRKNVFDLLVKLQKNPLIGIWNYTTLHNYSRSQLSIIP